MIGSHFEQFRGGKLTKLAVFSTLQPAIYTYEFGYLVKVDPKIVANSQKKTKLSYIYISSLGSHIRVGFLKWGTPFLETTVK